MKNHLRLIMLMIIANLYGATPVLEDKKSCTIFLPKYHVTVVNNVGTNSPPLRVHCASKNDEIANRTLAVDQNISWSFCGTFFKRTLFFCHFRWGSKDAAFEVFNSKNADLLCPGFSCYWEVRTDGMYLSGRYPPTKFQKMYNWTAH